MHFSSDKSVVSRRALRVGEKQLGSTKYGCGCGQDVEQGEKKSKEKLVS